MMGVAVHEASPSSSGPGPGAVTGPAAAATAASNTALTATTALAASPKASLICRPNSHPFQDRHLSLDQSVKVGRSVARARPTQSNAIFDCKVLSRNHALLWYEKGKFYLQDTKSSNGTFVNNQRLSKGSEESLPREVCSGDILQFGVDVMENSRKVTHGCIIATLKLYLPDGKEAKASPTIMSSVTGNGHVPTQDLYQLNQYIQDALAREQLLETKLAVLQRLVGQTEVASGQAWRSLIDEDRLLTRVEILESQLTAYSKSMTEDKLREETQRLMEEKEEYQEIAKETLKKLVDEKLIAVKALKDAQKQLSTTEDEFAVLKELYDKDVELHKKMAEELNNVTLELEEVKKKLPSTGNNEEEEKGNLDTTTTEEGGEKKETPAIQVDHPLALMSSGGAEDNSQVVEAKPEDASVAAAEAATVKTSPDSTSVPENDKQSQMSEVQSQLTLKVAELDSARQQCQELEESNAKLRAEIEQMQSAAASAHSEAAECSSIASTETVSEDMQRLEALVDSLRQEIQESREEQERLRGELAEAQNRPTAPGELAAPNFEAGLKDTSLNETSLNEVSLNASLVEAEEKITQLLKVKERYAKLSQNNEELEASFSELERQVDSLSYQSQLSTAFCIVPIGLLVLSIIIAYLPILASLFGTADQVP